MMVPNPVAHSVMTVRLPFRPLFILILLAASPTLCWAAPMVPPVESTDDLPPLQMLLSGEGPLQIAGRSVDRGSVTPIYQAHAYQSLWEAARQKALIKALGEADVQGLDPADYVIPAAGGIERDVLLTDAFLRYAAALARGRVSPTAIETDWLIQAPAFDGAKTIDLALSGDVGDVLGALPPKNPAYLRLLTALRRYRQLAKTAPWEPLSLSVPLAPGAVGDEVRQLRQRLAAENFLATGDGDTYDDELETAVKHFQ